MLRHGGGSLWKNTAIQTTADSAAQTPYFGKFGGVTAPLWMNSLAT